MPSFLKPYTLAFKDIGPIIYRHVFLLVNFIIFAVVGLLFSFGDKQASLFLGVIIVINILMGVIQDFRAKVSLERLQLITAFRFYRTDADGLEELVFVEQIKKGDHIRIKLGDQIPCDGIIVESKNIEISEALITGESDSFVKIKGDRVLAGGIVTAGEATVEVETIFSQSRISKMTADAKKYSASRSPIENTIKDTIKYSGYILILVVIFVVVRGAFFHEPWIRIVNDVGALASVIVPQGLVVITTILFAFGAASYSSKHVLFQEINATEKLGRIKNLCMDKTGTLTDNILIMEDIELPDGLTKEEVKILIAQYIKGSGDKSQRIDAIKKYIEGVSIEGEILDSLPFSSWRQFGAVKLRDKNEKEIVILVGPPDIFLLQVQDQREKEWLTNRLKAYTETGLHSLCIACSIGTDIPQKLSDTKLSLIASFTFKSKLRQGITEAINFFQDRGVHIRIISGDNIETVCSTAKLSGVLDTDKAISGDDMKSWSDIDYLEKAKNYNIFARIIPEQKVKLIEAFKGSGFTAMVGDGANDALAIKKSDLGIAMFDGAPASRALAGVILMNNSFTALPGAVKLADRFILNIQILSSIFLNQSILGFFFFFFMSIFGYTFSLTPLNITVINYFTVGLSGVLLSYWSLRPIGVILPADTKNFMKLILPLPLILGIIGAMGATLVFLFSPFYLKTSASNTLLIFSFIFFGYLFFVLASVSYQKILPFTQKIHLLLFVLFEAGLLFILFKIPVFINFFTINSNFPSLNDIYRMLIVVIIFGFIQCIATYLMFFRTKK